MSNSLQWIANHMNCPQCHSEDVEYALNTNTRGVDLECLDCGWSMSTNCDQMQKFGLNPMQRQEVEVTVLTEQGEIASQWKGYR